MSDPLLPVPDPDPGDDRLPTGEQEFEAVERDPEPDVLPGPGDDDHPAPEIDRAAFPTPVPGDGLTAEQLRTDLREE